MRAYVPWNLLLTHCGSRCTKPHTHSHFSTSRADRKGSLRRFGLISKPCRFVPVVIYSSAPPRCVSTIRPASSAPLTAVSQPCADLIASCAETRSRGSIKRKRSTLVRRRVSGFLSAAERPFWINFKWRTGGLGMARFLLFLALEMNNPYYSSVHPQQQGQKHRLPRCMKRFIHVGQQRGLARLELDR